MLAKTGPCRPRAALEHLAPRQRVDDLLRQRSGAGLARHQMQLGCLRRLVGLVDAGEILDLTGERALAVTLRIVATQIEQSIARRPQRQRCDGGGRRLALTVMVIRSPCVRAGTP